MKTTQAVIKILPFAPEFKDELLGQYDHFSPDQKFSINRLVWGLYDALYEARLYENTQLALGRAKKNEEKLDREFYARIRKQTKQEFEKESSNIATSVDLEDTREELEKLLKHPQ